jgi:hypothetical protein
MEQHIKDQLEQQEKRMLEFTNKLNAEFNEHRLRGLHRSERISEQALKEAIRVMKEGQHQDKKKRVNDVK